MRSVRLNAVANVVGRVITAFLWVAAVPFVLGRLGPERFGIWSLFFAFNAYLLWLDAGIGSTMLRYVATQRPAGDREAIRKTLRWGMWASMGLGLIWALAVGLLRNWIATIFHVPPEMVQETLAALLIFAIGVLMIFPVQALLSSLKGFERIDYSNLCQTVGVGVHVLALWITLSAGGGLVGAAWAGVIGQAVSGILAAILIEYEVRKVALSGPGIGPPWRELLKFSVALQVLGVLIILQIQSGRFVVGVLGNLTMVADYELAFRIAYALGGLPILIRDPVIPAVSRIWEQKGSAAVSELFRSTSQLVFTFSVIVLGLLWLLATDITLLWLGPGHERIADLIRLWVIANALNLAYAPGVAIARGMGMPRFEIMSYAAALVTSVGLAIVWVPRFGTAGAVYAVMFSYVIGFLTFVVAFHSGTKHFPFWPWLLRDLAPRVVAGFAAVAVSAMVLAIPSVAHHLPSPGMTRALLATALFLSLFALLFLPLGDTQRLFGSLRHLLAGAWSRRRGVPST